jgi:anthranilate phosphoribosyltransferase
MDIKDITEKIMGFKNLDKDEACEALKYIIEGRANDCQIASFLTALRMKGETIDEISGFCLAMLEKVKRVTSRHTDVVDTCGTGGDSKNTFNISTAAAFIAAGAGVIIAKHGNRSVSSMCGSADVLEQLGVNINLEPSGISECIDEIGIGFIFAPIAHTAMKNVAKARKDMAIKTVFNILGPLTNPAMANRRVLGVYDKSLMDKMVYVLKNLGVNRAFVVYGMDGLDEFSTAGNSLVKYLNDGGVTEFALNPEELGLKKCIIDDLRGGDAKINAEIIRNILSGGEIGAKRDSSMLNAAAAIIAGGKTESFQEALQMADCSISSGEATGKLNKLVGFTNKFQSASV